MAGIIEDAMAARNRARYLAPIALAATITATYVVVDAALTTKQSGGQQHAVQRSSVEHGKLTLATYYTVQSGDSLSSIAARTGVPVSTLEQLNPSVDPNRLQTGQRLRLRR
jgi:LysM repeat protein